MNIWAKSWVERIFRSQADNGGIRMQARNPSERTQGWSTAQCLKGVLASQVNLEQYTPNIKSAFRYIDNAYHFPPKNQEEGWGLFEEHEKTVTEIEGWVTLAYLMCNSLNDSNSKQPIQIKRRPLHLDVDKDTYCMR
jgi:hypothetical protein